VSRGVDIGLAAGVRTRWSDRIEFILELVLTTLWEIVLQISGESLVELGFHSVGEPFRRRSRAHPGLAAVGLVLLGAAAGALTSLIWPARIFQPGPVPGASLVLSPLITGVVMHRYGEWREDRGRTRSSVATFWGGALFAFSMASVRFLWVGR
jgi:hypothetical protein